MAEYIEREKAYEAVLFATCGSGYQYEATCAIDLIPDADVAPVVHGRWLNFYNDFSCAECDRCGTTFEVTDSESNEGLWNAFKLSYNYCPNCGAKMDGED